MKPKILCRISVAIVALSFLQYSMAAEPAELIDATEPGMIAVVMQGLGYRSKIEVDADGDPVIRSGAGGSDFTIQFYNCSEDLHDQCKTLLFVVSYVLDEATNLETINAWNKESLFDHAYLDDAGDPVLELGISMQGGVSRENFEYLIATWEKRVANFEKHVGF